jgi:hypothetical protein
MRSTAPLTFALASLALASSATAQNYVVAPARPAVVAPAPTYSYPAPDRTHDAPAPRPRRLLRVRKYSNRDTAAYKTILVDPNNRHWTFDPNEWARFNY